MSYSPTALPAVLKSVCVKTTITTRLGITFVIALMVISSLIVIFINPGLVAAAPTPSISEQTKTEGTDTSSYHTTPQIVSLLTRPSPTAEAPSTISQDGGSDFTTQAALSGVWARQTNNIVGVQSYYDIVFVTSTTGTIKFIDITFPAGTLIGAPPRWVEREGIGHGNAVLASSTTISYTVLNPVSIPEGTKIRLEFFNLVNPTVPSTGYKVTVTTKDAGGAIIDGPTASNSLNMKQISTGQIADNAVTSSKIADGTVSSNDLDPMLMISRFLLDNTQGASFGWNPDGIETDFIIFDEAVADSNAVLINVGDIDSNSQCEALGSLTGFFTIRCNTPPPQGSELRYTIINLPLS
ncbi:MAG: hypothetical protein GEU26_12255 [Nitrososphaeraceae archaeon]|nr:hypothetical protein [Nitrososphaeraceae archaeon]